MKQKNLRENAQETKTLMKQRRNTTRKPKKKIHKYKYFFLCESTFKKRFANHKSSFNHQRYNNRTSLSVELWKVKGLNGNPNVSWSNNSKSESLHTWIKALCLVSDRKVRDSQLPWRKSPQQKNRHHLEVSPPTKTPSTAPQSWWWHDDT